VKQSSLFPIDFVIAPAGVIPARRIPGRGGPGALHTIDYSNAKVQTSQQRGRDRPDRAELGSVGMIVFRRPCHRRRRYP